MQRKALSTSTVRLEHDAWLVGGDTPFSLRSIVLNGTPGKKGIARAGTGHPRGSFWIYPFSQRIQWGTWTYIFGGQKYIESSAIRELRGCKPIAWLLARERRLLGSRPALERHESIMTKYCPFSMGFFLSPFLSDSNCRLSKRHFRYCVFEGTPDRKWAPIRNKFR